MNTYLRKELTICGGKSSSVGNTQSARSASYTEGETEEDLMEQFWHKTFHFNQDLYYTFLKFKSES